MLSGVVEALDNGSWVALHAGDTHVCASGESHALRNFGSTEAEVLMLILNEGKLA